MVSKWNCILLSKLFWPTVRKNCYSVRGQNNFLEQNAFSTCSWRCLISNQLEFNMHRQIWICENKIGETISLVDNNLQTNFFSRIFNPKLNISELAQALLRMLNLQSPFGFDHCERWTWWRYLLPNVLCSQIWHERIWIWPRCRNSGIGMTFDFF